MTALLDAPCIFCGYNGQRYYSEWTHAKSCPWHSVGGAAERTEQLRMVIQEQAERLEAAGREIAALREHYETSLELESALHAKIEERQAAEIASLREKNTKLIDEKALLCLQIQNLREAIGLLTTLPLEVGAKRVDFRSDPYAAAQAIFDTVQNEIGALREAVRDADEIIKAESGFDYPTGRQERWYDLPAVRRALGEER